MFLRKKMIVTMLLIVVIIFMITILCNTVPNVMLFRGILEREPDIVKKSVLLGADVNRERFPYPWCNIFETNDTPLTLACERGDESIVQLLIDSGADVNQFESWGGDCPLMAALRYDKINRFDLALLLIEYGADINVAADQEIRSPLWLSVKICPADTPDTTRKGYELFQYLIENLEEQVSQKEVKLLYDYALEQRNESVIEYLLEHEDKGRFETTEKRPSLGQD